LFSSVLLFSCFLVSVLYGEQKVKKSLPVVITGTIIGAEFDEVTISICDKISPNDKYNSFISKIDMNGNYYFMIDTYEMARSYISLGETKKVCELYLLPGDDLDLRIEFEFGEKKPIITFNGKMSGIQKFFVELDEKFPFDSDYFECFYYSSNYSQCKRYWDNWRDRQLEFHKQYFKDTDLPQAVVSEALNKIQYEWAYSRTYYLLFHHYWAQEEPIKLDGHDYDYLNEIQFNNPSGRYSYKYRKFLNMYGTLLYWRTMAQWDTVSTFRQRIIGFYDLAIQDVGGVARDIVIAGRINDELQIVANSENMSVVKDVLDRFKMLTNGNEYYQNSLDVYNKRLELMPNEPAYNFTLDDLNGNKKSLSDFRGKVVYIDFWSIGCSPCMKEIPYMKKLGTKLKDVCDEFEFVSINTNYGESEKINNFVTKRNIPGTHLITSLKTNKTLHEEYMFNGNPHYVLIDRAGNIIKPNMGRPSHKKTEETIRAAIAK